MKSLRWGGVILCFNLNNTRESELQLFSFIEEGLRGLIRSWNGLRFFGCRFRPKPATHSGNNFTTLFYNIKLALDLFRVYYIVFV